MAANRRRQLVLAGLVVVLALVGYRVWLATSAEPSASSNGTATKSTAGRKAAAATPEAPDVHLNALEGARPKPLDADRNLFRFKTKPPPPPPPAPVRVAPPPVLAAPPAPTG